jgi:RNA polymerase sigma-70 factor (ECF subfamily)
MHVAIAAPWGRDHIRRHVIKALAGALSHPAVRSPERVRDRQLLERVAHGDMKALRTLYDEHGGRALAVAHRILKDRTEAEDIVQETFLELWRRAATYDHDRAGAAAWIVTIARSRAIDRLRATTRATRAVSVVAGTSAAASGAALPPPALSPSDAAERTGERIRIDRALAALPAEQRKTIELAYYEGLSQREIAATTGNPLGTVKMRVRLAMSKLAALLREE